MKTDFVALWLIVFQPCFHEQRAEDNKRLFSSTVKCAAKFCSTTKNTLQPDEPP